MANFSDFDGDLIISGTDKASVVAVSNIIVDAMRKWTYDFYADPEEITERDVYFSSDNADKECQLEYQAKFSGDGYGRWSFANNIRSLGRWLAEDLKGSEKLETLEQASFSVQFIGTDIERGFGLYDSLTGTMFHEKGVPLKDSIVEINCRSLGELTVDALMEHYGWDEDEAKEYLGVE